VLQGTLFPPEVSWRAPRLADLPQDWSQLTKVSYDTETHDEHLEELGCGARRGAEVVGYCLGFEARDGSRRSFYLPVRHLGGDNCDEGPEAVERYVRDQAARYTGTLVGAKLDYDLDMSAAMGIEFGPGVRYKDVQVAEPLLDELQFSYSLNNILTRHGLETKDETVFLRAIQDFRLNTKKPKKDLWKLPARYVGAYGERDVLAPLELIARQEEEIERRGLSRIWELEQAVTPILVKMRRRGIRIDNDHLDKMDRWARAEEQKAWGELHRITGVAVRVGDAMKAEVLAPALRAVNIEPGRTATGKPSIDKYWLEALDHPVGKIIRRARQVSQLRTTFVASMREHQVRGRVHCTFNQIVRQKDEDGGDGKEGAAYGRLSAVDPNLQQQPARDPEIGPEWRKIFVADEGAELCAPDYSQQEPRLAVHAAVASGPRLIGERAYQSAVDAARRYHEDRSTDAHTMFCQMVHPDFLDWEKARAKQTRTIYKNIYLGICYGEGEPKMCRELGLPTEIYEDERTGKRWEVAGPEGKRILQLIDRQVPYVKSTALSVQKAARAKGYVKTIYGRQLHFPRDRFGNLEYLHKAFNRYIQGSAADQTKAAMVALDAEGIPLQLQIHDEVVFSTANRALARRAAAIMESVVELHVPSKVDLEVGPSWGNLELLAA
jgi:DNA polymerase I-like protein with 3'-5' exonuclease and polymerase domains